MVIDPTQFNPREDVYGSFDQYDEDPRPVQAGQGRTVRDVCESARIIWIAAIGGLAWAVIAIAYEIGRFSSK